MPPLKILLRYIMSAQLSETLWDVSWTLVQNKAPSGGVQRLGKVTPPTVLIELCPFKIFNKEIVSSQ